MHKAAFPRKCTGNKDHRIVKNKTGTRIYLCSTYDVMSISRHQMFSFIQKLLIIKQNVLGQLFCSDRNRVTLGVKVSKSSKGIPFAELVFTLLPIKTN